MFETLQLNRPNHVNYQDVIAFSCMRNDKEGASKIIQSNVGLSNLEEIAEQLSRGDYIPVLKAVWSERDRQKRLEWLRDQVENGLHTILFFELAVAEFKNNSTIDNLNSLVLPLMDAGQFRVQQDMACFNCDRAQVCEAILLLSTNYFASISSIMKTNEKNKSGPKVSEYMAQESNREAQIEKKLATCRKIQEIAQRSFTVTLPSPEWVGHHLMSADQVSSHLKSSDECKQIREKLAKKVIDGFVNLKVIEPQGINVVFST